MPEMLVDMEVPGLQSAKYYIEKFMDSAPFGWTRSMLELFDNMKVVMLFRDPRDVLISYEAYRKREPINALEGDLKKQIEGIMQHYAGRLKLYDEQPDRVFILRYEDLIERPRKVLVPMLDFLGLDASEDTLEKMLHPLLKEDLQSRRHITAGSKEESMGRWQQEMSLAASNLFATYTETEIKRRLGYSVYAAD
jgi:hypothetical protein